MRDGGASVLHLCQIGNLKCGGNIPIYVCSIVAQSLHNNLLSIDIIMNHDWCILVFSCLVFSVDL